MVVAQCECRVDRAVSEVIARVLLEADAGIDHAQRPRRTRQRAIQARRATKKVSKKPLGRTVTARGPADFVSTRIRRPCARRDPECDDLVIVPVLIEMLPARDRRARTPSSLLRVEPEHPPAAAVTRRTFPSSPACEIRARLDSVAAMRTRACTSNASGDGFDDLLARVRPIIPQSRVSPATSGRSG